MKNHYHKSQTNPPPPSRDKDASAYRVTKAIGHTSKVYGAHDKQGVEA